MHPGLQVPSELSVSVEKDWKTQTMKSRFAVMNCINEQQIRCCELENDLGNVTSYVSPAPVANFWDFIQRTRKRVL